MTQWPSLPSPGFPLIFHGIEGEDLRESSSPSWFNPSEASQVLEYVRELLEYRQSRVRQEDIGVIGM